MYAYSTEQVGFNSPFIAMEYIEGQPLDTLWDSLSQTEKETIIDEIVQLLVEMGEIDLGTIGGMTLNHTLGSTVEGIKLFRGRVWSPTVILFRLTPFFENGGSWTDPVDAAQISFIGML